MWTVSGEKKERLSAWIAAGGGALVAMAACMPAGEEVGTAGDASPLQEDEFQDTQALLAAKHSITDSEVVLEWNEFAVSTAAEVDEFLALRAHRTIAMMHLAMHDALNSIVPFYETYAYRGLSIADPRIAVSRAAKDVMLDAYPGHEEAIKGLHADWQAEASSWFLAMKGEKLGAAAAEEIIALREDDGTDLPPVVPYEPGDEPGDYQFTPPFDFAFGENWGHAEPFAMTSQDQFLGDGPPAVDSEEYAETFNEVKELGVLDSEARTEDQTHIAYWWAEFAETWFPRLGRQLVRDRDMNMWDAARLYALFSMDNFDGYVANFNAKYQYNFWRPQTAIRAADTDGNPDTVADPGWESEMVALPFPDHPSAHQQACAGAVEVFTHVLGTSEVSFTMDSLTAPDFGPKTRSYDDLDDASEDCGLSRVYNGFHFGAAVDAGKVQGRERARYIVDNFLRPKWDRDGARH